MKEIYYVFRFWNQSGEENAELCEDRYLCAMRRLRTVSGFYDILLEHGEQADITETDLTLVQAGRRTSGWNRKHCEACGYETEEDFEYCPKCGRKF